MFLRDLVQDPNNALLKAFPSNPGGDVSLLTVAKQSFKEWIDPTIAATITGNPVAMIKSPDAGGFVSAPNFQHSTLIANDNPDLTANRIVFNGTSDLLDSSAGYTFGTATTPADPFYSEAGKGPTTTGLARASDGTWWVGHYGKLNQDTAAGETFDGSLIHYSADFLTIIQEIRFAQAPLSIANVGVQGVCIDAQDGTLWCNDLTNGHIYNINPVDSSLVHDFTFAGCNGLTYDSINNRLIVCRVDNNTCSYVNKATGATISTFTIRDIVDGSQDHLFFDASYGSAGALYISCRDNGTNGRVIKYDLSVTALPVKAWSFTEVQSIEGIVVVGSTFYLCNDEYYHNQPADVNRVVSVTVDTSSPAYGTTLVMAGVAKIAATPAASVALISGSDPNSTTTNARLGAGLYFTTTPNQFRSISKINGTQVVLDWLLTSTTTEFLYYVLIDTVAHTGTLYINGTIVGTAQSNANLTGSIPRLLWTMAAAYETTALPTRFSATTQGGLIITTENLHRAEIEGYLAWQTSNTGLLPSDHVYKNSAPL